jgi:hypothetical protein
MKRIIRSRALAVIPFGILLLHSAVALAQPWSGILSPSRAIDWTKAGLPSTITYGSGGSACNGASANCVETVANGWTPPTRVQSGSTISCANTTADAGTINTALAAAKPGSYVLLGPTTCNINANITMRNGVTLRGSGSMNTILNVSSSANISFGNQSTSHNGPLSGSYAAGVTSITITGGNDSGSGMPGFIARLSQCNTGYTVWSSYQTCSTGSTSDNGGLYICDDTGCALNPSNAHAGQVQIILVTAVSGNCTSSCTVTFTPPLYAPNWSSTVAARLEWGTGPAIGAGVEDLTYSLPTAIGQIALDGYASWAKGNRILGPGTIMNVSGLNNLVMSNYIFGQSLSYVTTGDEEPFGRATDTSTLILNNIVTGGEGFWGNGYLMGEVLAYNYSAYDQSSNSINNLINHGDGTELFTYAEGNELPLQHSDDNHTSNDLFIAFRNYFSVLDGSSLAANPDAVQMDNFQRFDSYIGNVLGSSISSSILSPIYGSFSYQGSDCCEKMWAFPTTDNLATVSSMRWGNVDVVTGSPRWCGRTDPSFSSAPCSNTSEVPDSVTMPSGTYPNAAKWQNTTPSNHNIPCTFLFSSSTAPCSILTNGGTGLPFWNVCKTWTTFGTSCATTQTQPYPPIGPDQSGGPYVKGYAYDIPAAIAFKNLPVDTLLQGSFTIASSSWSATSCASTTTTIPGPCEVLTINSSIGGGAYHVVGPFQLSGVNASCHPASGLSYTGRPDGEILILGNTEVSGSQIKIVYALPGVSSDPGCTGTFKWPDVRQFDERVYINDPGSTTQNAPSAPPIISATAR